MVKWSTKGVGCLCSFGSMVAFEVEQMEEIDFGIENEQ
jgi:hypothetical protein